MIDSVETSGKDHPDQEASLTDEPGTNNSTALGRWSQRKLAAQQPMPSTQLPADQSEGSIAPPISSSESGRKLSEPITSAPSDQITDGDVSEETEEPILSDADMPEIETLSSDSNISCFFNQGVSEDLRQAAIKYLLRLPAFNIRDGLNDYDEDYTSFEPLGDTVTSDMRFHAERKALLEEERVARELAENDEPETEECSEAQAETTASAEDSAPEPIDGSETETEVETEAGLSDTELSSNVTDEIKPQARREAEHDQLIQHPTIATDSGEQT